MRPPSAEGRPGRRERRRLDTAARWRSRSASRSASIFSIIGGSPGAASAAGTPAGCGKRVAGGGRAGPARRPVRRGRRRRSFLRRLSGGRAFTGAGRGKPDRQPGTYSSELITVNLAVDLLFERPVRWLGGHSGGTARSLRCIFPRRVAAGVGDLPAASAPAGPPYPGAARGGRVAARRRGCRSFCGPAFLPALLQRAGKGRAFCSCRPERAGPVGGSAERGGDGAEGSRPPSHLRHCWSWPVSAGAAGRGGRRGPAGHPRGNSRNKRAIRQPRIFLQKIYRLGWVSGSCLPRLRRRPMTLLRPRNFNGRFQRRDVTPVSLLGRLPR